MKLSRRHFLQGSSLLAILTAASSLIVGSKAAIHGSPTLFNGGVTQTNPTVTGNFFWINFFKTARAFGYDRAPSSSTAPGVPIAELDANGYPTSIPAGAVAWNTGFSLLTPAEYSGQWIIQWDGTGTCGIRNFQFTIISQTANSIIFKNQLQVGFNPNFFCSATSAAPNNVRNVRITRYQNATPDDTTLLANGAVFFPDFLALYKSAKFGAMRSLTLGSPANGTNTSTLATWAQRRSTTWATYSGTQYRADWYGGFTTNNGSDYSLTFLGWIFIDKNVVQLVFNVTAPQIGRKQISWFTTNTVAININWRSHGLAVGNAVCFGNTGSPPIALTPARTYFINDVVDANNFTVSATSGGSSVVATATASGTMFVVSIARLNVNSSGFLPIASQGLSQPGNVFSTGRPTNGGNQVTTLTYDATTQAYWIPQDFATSGMLNQFPPELWVDFCAQCGSHPWLVTPFLAAEDVAGGFSYMVNWANYATSTYPWMKPVIEPPNETWGSGRTAFTASTSYAPTVAYVLWGSTDLHQAYGRWVSRIGQAISAHYGNDRTKYSMICAVQTATFNASINVQSNPRLTAALDVSMSGGSPAYSWCDRVCGANYIQSDQDNLTCLGMIAGFNYSQAVIAGKTSLANSTVNAFVNGANDGTNKGYTVTYVIQCFSNIKAWGQGISGSNNTIKGIVGYEGGWSMGYATTVANPVPGGGGVTGITGATISGAGGPTTVQLATTTTLPYPSSGQGNSVGATPPNPAQVGWAISISGVAGMTQLNCSSFSVTTSGSTLSATNTLVANQCITIQSSSSLPGTVNPTQLYYVVNPTSTTFQLSLTRGGSAISIGTSSFTVQSGWFITAVGGALGANGISIDVDSSSFSAYTSGGAAYWMNCALYQTNLLYASLASSALGTVNSAMYTAYFALASSGFVAEFPSNFIVSGSALPWTVLYPDIYAPLTPQWNSIVAENA